MASILGGSAPETIVRPSLSIETVNEGLGDSDAILAAYWYEHPTREAISLAVRPADLSSRIRVALEISMGES